ncbi:MAG: hypothetical protein KAH24_04750 [Holophagae bacterium]|nr:hypothetical protein [Holophagae bacterium]
MNNRVLVAVLLGLLMFFGIIYFTYMNDKQKAAKYQKAEKKVMETQGERHHEWTPFYYAESGTWKILDDATYVLKEKKFVSGASERDAYTIYKLKSGDIVRTIESQGRWKKVEVLVDDQVAATGWIDAHFIKNVEEVPSAVNDE